MTAATISRSITRHCDRRIGATPAANGTCFRVWAPDVERIDVVVDTRDGEVISQMLGHSDDGMFTGWVSSVGCGDRYRFRVNRRGMFPDPASRYQPEGVHGPSEIVDSSHFPWTDTDWYGIGLDELIIYEVHVGTFTPAGTFAAACERLPYLAELGVTAIELMPVAEFPGERNWGYDGVSLFAPAQCYGPPDDFRRFVNEAHQLGLAVILDVVYNHLGPDGNYLGIYSKHFVTDRHPTPWGSAHNFDGAYSEHVREFFIENAIHWVREYHVDGLRLDATHAIFDNGPRHFLAELTERVQMSDSNRQILVIAEDDRNLACMVRSPRDGGWGLDAVWADGFHHQVRRLLAGDREGYFRDFTGTTHDLATTMRKGWFHCGQFSEHRGRSLGTDPSDLSHAQFVYCLQNHDQIGNRAHGERLNHQIEPAAFRAATALLLCGPATPLLYMGQEWAASSPFLYFTDHEDELGRKVTVGRRHEFRDFAAFSDSKTRDEIPDPQALSTFLASKLKWSEQANEKHASILRLYRELLRLRRTEAALRSAERRVFEVHAADEGTIVLSRYANSTRLIVVIRLKGKGTVDLRDCGALRQTPRRHWEVVLTTEDDRFSLEQNHPEIDISESMPVIVFHGPAAVILRGRFENGHCFK